MPLLVEAAAPEASPPTPVLRDMAVRLITAMPTAATGGAAFRSAIAALPMSSKAHLQAALRESAAAGGSASGSASGSGAGSGAAGAGGAAARATAQPAKPTIQLKMTFALPKS